mmetsp:Transcript_31006/g.81176  ORF Transcript_31006/g.81176 Transcript_31006/m.81176 type:complete len:192 (+) Transcript_31006:227-802(+)
MADAAGAGEGESLNDPARYAVEEVVQVHDNGGRPFRVTISDSRPGHRCAVTAHKCDGGDKVWACAQAAAVFVGQHPAEDPIPGVPEGWARGNSVLVAVTPLRYCFIGWNIYEFTTTEPILEYHSMVGNSDVPYPVAASNDRIYFMLDAAKHVDRSLLSPDVPLWDAYQDFYDRLEDVAAPAEGVVEKCARI